MEDRLLHRKEVMKMTGLSRSSIYVYQNKYGFPKPINIGPRAVRWQESLVKAWIDSKVQAAESVNNNESK